MFVVRDHAETSSAAIGPMPNFGVHSEPSPWSSASSVDNVAPGQLAGQLLRIRVCADNVCGIQVWCVLLLLLISHPHAAPCSSYLTLDAEC